MRTLQMWIAIATLLVVGAVVGYRLGVAYPLPSLYHYFHHVQPSPTHSTVLTRSR